jgi:periplasmic protein TonB
MTQETLEKEVSKNKKVALIWTSIINLALFLGFAYFTIWTAEENTQVDLTGGGFIVNYGNDDVGSGDVQTRNKPSPSKEIIESKPAEKAESKKTPVKKFKPVEAPITKPVKAKPTPEVPVISSKAPSPVKVKEVPDTKVVEAKANTKPVDSKPAVKPAPEQPKVNNDALYPGKKSSSNGTTGTDSRPGGNSNGDDKGKVGDKGIPEGKINDSEIYKGPSGNKPGTGGGPGGPGLSLTGWTWDSRPNVDDNSDETGVIKFRIKVNSDGDLQSVELIESTVSPSVSQKYKRAVQKLSFKPTSGGDRPDVSTGTIVFKLNGK